MPRTNQSMKGGLEQTPMIQTLFEMEALLTELGEISNMSTQLIESPAVFPDTVKENASTYEPLSSVWEGTDGDLLEAMLSFYPTIPPEPILDATYNTGRFWKGSKRSVVSMDIDPRHNPMIVCDNRQMTGVPSAEFGAVVFDPPHVGPQGRDKSKKRFDVDFGATVECGKEHNWNLSYLYPPFLKEAKRVLKPDGLLLAKITDMVNNHKSKWPHTDFMRMADEAGFTVCDLIIKVRNGPMVSNKWKEAHHARKRHCFWIVCRNGNACEREVKAVSAGTSDPKD
ncbi:MAG TPA: hypothetical protein VJ023_02800 [Pyrinomonadaceae bacterium]|nr:hypothetical protein [Pyrinomonadaceae bacterium]